MRILKTRLYFAGEETVEVYREVTPDEVKRVQFWVPVIKDGVAFRIKPEPLIVGQDHWPDWDRLVKQAGRKLHDARRRNFALDVKRSVNGRSRRTAWSSSWAAMVRRRRRKSRRY